MKLIKFENQNREALVCLTKEEFLRIYAATRTGNTGDQDYVISNHFGVEIEYYDNWVNKDVKSIIEQWPEHENNNIIKFVYKAL